MKKDMGQLHMSGGYKNSNAPELKENVSLKNTSVNYLT